MTGAIPVLKGGAPERCFAGYLRRLLEGSERVLDIGTPQRFAKELRPYERLFDGKQYVAAGFEPSMSYGRYNCDCHQDIEAMTFADASFDGVICLEVLEHVKDPFRAGTELLRVLRPGGKLLVTTPFLLPYHGHGGASQSHQEFPDHWRFTHQGLPLLFPGLREIELQCLDGPIEGRLRLLRLDPLRGIQPVRLLLDLLDRRVPGKFTTRHLLFGVR